MVGIARIPYSAAIASLSSMLTFATVSFPSNSTASSSRMGAIALHGPHHGAQKSTRRGVVDAATAALNVSVVRWAIFSDIGTSEGDPGINANGQKPIRLFRGEFLHDFSQFSAP